MHPLLGIPLASLVAAGVLASAFAAREPDRELSRLMSLVLLFAGIWSGFELLVATAPDADIAVSWMRASAFASCAMGPLVLHLVLTVVRPALDRLRPFVAPSYVAAALAAAFVAGTDLVIADARPTAWGWTIVPGPAITGVYVAIAALPIAALALWLRARRSHSSSQRQRYRILESGAVFSAIGATASEVALPALGIDCPRLGSTCLVLWGGIAWQSIYRHRSPGLAPQRFAREILDTLPDGIALVRPDGRIRSTNERFAQLVGCAPAELLGSHIAAFLDEPESEGGPDRPERETVLRRARGEPLPVSVTELPLSEASGPTIGRVFVVRDLREIAALRSRLAASGRLVAVGQLAAGIAHEINNPIAYVGANVRLLEQELAQLADALPKPLAPAAEGALEDCPPLIARAREGVERVAAIVRDVGSFSGGGLEREAADLPALLDTAARVAAQQLAGAHISRDYRPCPLVRCVPQELMQVFLDLLVNARRAVDEGGRIELASFGDESGDAVIEVRDDGHGVPAELQTRIFEPCFTTREEEAEAGLGLALSRQIVESHGGRLELESSPGAGTTLRVRMPPAAPARAEAG